MSIIRQVFGIALILLAWFNPLNVALPLRIALFIIGFDATNMVIKLLLFVFNFFFPLLGSAGNFLTWTLLFMLVGEFIISFLGISSFLISLIKPLIVFITIFFGMDNIQLALVIAGFDLILNLTH